MQQVVVPQFLDVEDKVLGSISVRQFSELVVGGLIMVVFYKVFDFSLFVVSSMIVLALTLLLAFTKINGQPFHLFMLNFLQTMRKPKLTIWKKAINLKELRALLMAPPPAKMARHVVMRSPVTSSKLSEISLIIDTGGVYMGENNEAVR